MATNFTHVPLAHRRLRRLRESEGNLTTLGPVGEAAAAGDAFRPACPVVTPCDTAAATSGLLSVDDAVVHSQCVHVQQITVESSVLVTSLHNDTQYRLLVVTTDLLGHRAAWSALVHTQDLTPPSLRILAAPLAGFTFFQVSVSLDEPGVMYAGLSLAADAALAVSSPACPPSFPVRLCLGGTPFARRTAAK